MLTIRRLYDYYCENNMLCHYIYTNGYEQDALFVLLQRLIRVKCMYIDFTTTEV